MVNWRVIYLFFKILVYASLYFVCTSSLKTDSILSFFSLPWFLSYYFQLGLLILDENKQGGQLIIPKGLLLVAHEPSVVNTAPGPHIRGNTLRAYSIGDKEVDLLLPGTARYDVILIVSISIFINLAPLQLSSLLLDASV